MLILYSQFQFILKQEALTVEEKLSADLFCAVMPISAHALPASREICI